MPLLQALNRLKGDILRALPAIASSMEAVNLKAEIQVGKGCVLRIPRALAEAAGLKEGTKVLVLIKGGNMVISPIREEAESPSPNKDVEPDPLSLALAGSKFMSVTPEQVEAISIEEQKRYSKGSS